MRDDDPQDPGEVSGGWLSGACRPDAPEPEPEDLGRALREFAATATFDQLAEMGGRMVAAMTSEWDCLAYGPEVRTAVGALCFFSPTPGTRACPTRDTCAQALAAERRRVFDQIHEMAAADPAGIWAHLAAEITDPEQLLRGALDADPGSG
jgi:hypothetical protein